MQTHSQSPTALPAVEAEDDAIAKLFQDAQSAQEAAAAALYAEGLAGESTVRVLQDNVDTPDWFLYVEKAEGEAYVVQISDDHQRATVYEVRARLHAL